VREPFDAPSKTTGCSDGSSATSISIGRSSTTELTPPLETDSELEIELYDVSDDDETALRDDPPELGVGDAVEVGYRVRTFDVEVGTFDETLTIIAEKTE